MGFRFAATIFLSIKASALAHSLHDKPVKLAEVDKKPPVIEDQAVVRTHGSYHQQVAQAPDVESPVLRVHHHKDAVAVDGKGEAQFFEAPEPEVPPVVLQDKPRTPIIMTPKATSNQQVANSSAPSLVVRAESHSDQATVDPKPHVAEVVGGNGEAVQSRVRNRARKQSANGMVLEEGSDKQDEIPETDSAVGQAPSVVRTEVHPSGLTETSGQWPPRGAAAETHIVLVFLALGISIGVLAFAGVCGGFEKAEPKASRNPNDILSEVYASATSPGVTSAATAAPAIPEKTGAFMVPSKVDQ